MTKTPIITAVLILLGYYRLFSNLYIDEHTGLITTSNQLLKNTDKLPRYIDDNLSSQISRLGLPLTVFHPVFDTVHEHSHSGLHIAHFIRPEYLPSIAVKMATKSYS